MTSRLVVDSSVAIKWALNEIDSDRATRLLRAYQKGAVALLAPDLFVSEVGQVTWQKCILRNEITELQSATALSLILAASVEIVSSRSLIEQAFRLAIVHRRSVYDCLYVALALREQCDFVTADDRLVNALQGPLPCVVHLSQLR